MKEPTMASFTLIDGATAIIRTSSGIYKELAVYHSDETLYVPMSGGYAKIAGSLGSGMYATSNGKTKVTWLHVEGMVLDKFNPIYRPKPKKKLKAVND